MKKLINVISRHSDRPSLDTKLNLDAWELSGDLNSKYSCEEELVKYITDELKLLFKFGNGNSLLGLLDRKSMMKRLFDKRPTSVELFYEDGTNKKYDIMYPNGCDYTLVIFYRIQLFILSN